MQDLHHLYPTIEFIADIYEKNSQPTSQYYEICQQFARISKLVVKVSLSIYIVTLTVTALLGTCETLLTGNYKPTMVIYFPGIHEYSTQMMVVSLTVNHLMVVVSLLSIPPGDIFFFILFANMPMVPAVIKGHFDELTRKLEHTGKVVNVMEVKRRIVQYIGMQRRYNE
jgi:hypothetical protein